MESSSSRKFTISVVLLGVIILIASVILTYVILSQVLNKPGVSDNTNVNVPEESENNVSAPIVENKNPEKDLVKEVDIYFFNQNKFDAAESDIFSKVTRSTNRIDIATFTIEQIIEGPTVADSNINLGLVKSFADPSETETQFLATISGESTCGGKDFEITSLEGKIATIKFCKNIVTTGDFSSGIIFEQFRKTLTQFSTIEKVRVLRNDNTCFNDSVEMTFEECVR